MSEPAEEHEEPLDPAMERVRRKLVRLLMVSSSIMILGLGAVFAGIFYRVSEMGADEPTVEARVSLPVRAAELAGASVEGERLVLVLRGAAPRIEVRRLADGALLQTFALEGAPAKEPGALR